MGQLDVVELRNRDPECLLDAPEARLAGPFGRPRDLLEEVATEGIVRSPDRPIGVPDELGHDVQIADAREEGRQLSKLRVHVDLFEVGLREPRGIGRILFLRAVQRGLVAASNTLRTDERPTLAVLVERQLVHPRLRAVLDRDADRDVRLAPGREAADRRDPAAQPDRLLEPATRRCQIAQEPKRVQEVRLARGVRPDQEHTVLDGRLGGGEVLPVLQRDPADPHPLPPYDRAFARASVGVVIAVPGRRRGFGSHE